MPFSGKEMQVELLRNNRRVKMITDDKYYDFDSPQLYT